MGSETIGQAFDPASFEHVPVLLNECLDGLAIDPAGTYLDGTAGGAGHSRQIALRLDAEQGGRLISLDQDPDAVQTARGAAGRAACHRGADQLPLCGTSSGTAGHRQDQRSAAGSRRFQPPAGRCRQRLFLPGRRSAGHADEPGGRDRRRPREHREPGGAGPHPQGLWRRTLRLADRGQDRRGAGDFPIETTLQLADIVASAMPAAERRKNKNPSRRTFQALRIAVNHELDALEEGMDTIFEHLAPGGRLCIITFHSLEDRLVKNKFRRWATACTCPPEFPVCVCGGRAKAKLITRRPIEANTQELEENRRSRSAHLRVLEKI